MTYSPPPPSSHHRSPELSQPSSNTGTVSKASWLPLFLALISIICSIGIWAMYQGRAVSPFVYLAGYLLTPFSVVIMMGWDTFAQRKNISRNPWFIPKPKFSRILRGLTIFSFIVAIPHIWRLAQIVADYVPKPIADLLLQMSN